MKLEDLHKAKIRKSKFVNDAYEIVGRNGSVARIVYSGRYDDSGFDDCQTALLAAARFRASEEVVESGKNLLAALEDFHISVEDYPWMSEAFERFRAALAMADNTNETLPK